MLQTTNSLHRDHNKKLLQNAVTKEAVADDNAAAVVDAANPGRRNAAEATENAAEAIDTNPHPGTLYPDALREDPAVAAQLDPLVSNW